MVAERPGGGTLAFLCPQRPEAALQRGEELRALPQLRLSLPLSPAPGLVRAQEGGLQQFLRLDGFSVLMRAMQSPVEKLKVKSAFLLQNLLLDHPEHKGEGPPGRWGALPSASRPARPPLLGQVPPSASRPAMPRLPPNLALRGGVILCRRPPPGAMLQPPNSLLSLSRDPVLHGDGAAAGGSDPL